MTRLPKVERAILRQKSRFEGVFWSLSAVIIATAIRLAIDGGASGAPFVTYFPAVVLIALFVGWKAATLVAILSAILGNRFFRPELPITAFETADFIMAGLFALSCAVLINAGNLVRRLLVAEQEARDRETLLNSELIHRVRNMLTVTQSLAVATLKYSGPDQFLEAFTGRLSAMVKATELITSKQNEVRDLRDIIENTIKPFQIGGNFSLDGSDVEVPQSAVVPLALAIHELSTNALKHGALSNGNGRVTVIWGMKEHGDLVLVWSEENGPPVREPTRRGMGTSLLRTGRGLNDVQIIFNPAGVRCTILIKNCQFL